MESRLTIPFAALQPQPTVPDTVCCFKRHRWHVYWRWIRVGREKSNRAWGVNEFELGKTTQKDGLWLAIAQGQLVWSSREQRMFKLNSQNLIMMSFWDAFFCYKSNQCGNCSLNGQCVTENESKPSNTMQPDVHRWWGESGNWEVGGKAIPYSL